MSELKSIETYSSLRALPLSDQTKFRLNEINKINNYFVSEIQERKAMSKKLSKYIGTFDYINKILIILSAASGGISIISSTSIIRIPAGIASASFTLVFSLTTEKKKKHDKIIMLAKSKLNNIETLMSQALIDLYISHEEFKTIVNEKEKYDQMKESIRNKKIEMNWVKIVKMHRFRKEIFFYFVCIKWLLLPFKVIQMQKFTQ